MPPQLMALTDGPNILLDKPIILVGRHQECDIQISSRKISRKHCCIAQVNSVLLVRDLYSTNGIRINGKRVLEGYLKTGDELTIANFRYQVQLQPESLPGENGSRSAPQEQETLPRAHKDFESGEEPIALPDSLDKSARRPSQHPPLPPPNQLNSGSHSDEMHISR